MCYLAQDLAANFICEINCLALDGFNLNTVHKLSSEEEKSRRSQDTNPGLQGAMQPPTTFKLIFSPIVELVIFEILTNSRTGTS